jgi:aryl-alcohol dehydrogenase-like predicted oxidoreductase
MMAANFLPKVAEVAQRHDNLHRLAAGVQKAYMTERGFAVLAAVEKIAAGLGVTPTQVAISWLAHRPGITAPIASATSKPQLQELLAGVELQLDAEADKTLDEASAWREA